MIFVRFVLYLIVGLLVVSCDNSSTNDPVLARVGDRTVNQSHLDVMMERLTPEARKRKGNKVNETILKGLVRTKALAMIAEQKLNEDELKHLNAKVQAYRDEFLVHTYIKKNIKPKVVTPVMVSEYYESHIADYTKKGKISFEMISTTSETVSDDVLTGVISSLTKAKNIANWKAYTKKLTKQQYPVEFRSAQMLPSSINKEMQSHALKLKEGEASNVIYGKRMYVFRVIDKQPDIIEPLHKVSVSIRKKLAPLQLKKELTKAIDQVLLNIDVEYVK